MEKTKLISEDKFIKQNEAEEEKEDQENIKELIEKEIQLSESHSEADKEQLSQTNKNEDEDNEEDKKKEGDPKETQIEKDVFMINLEEEKGQAKKIGTPPLLF